MEEVRHSLFVYGTLKKGGSNHGFMAEQRFLGEAHSDPGFSLIDLGDFPGLVPCDDDQAGVVGEVWSVDQACLTALDQLEGVDEGLYRRAPIHLSPSFEQGVVETYFFAGSLLGRKRLAGGSWPIKA